MNTKTQVSSLPPADFSAKVSIAACYLENDGKLLLLRRSINKKEGGLWGVPAGKVEPDEIPIQAAARELREETGIEVEISSLQALECLYIRKTEIDYTYHMFCLKLAERPPVQLNHENQDFTWAAPHEIESLPLMGGGRSTYLRYCSSLPSAKNRTMASVSAYLILKREGSVLLGLRKNTGYCDGMWSFPAGHVEDGETATSAMVREAGEEIGVRLEPSSLEAAHIIHRQSNRLNIDIFFTCSKWEGEIENREPEKCEKLQFFPLNALPENLVGYNRATLDAVADGKFYSELGWNE